MAYFSNGTEGDMYHEEFCQKCVHWTEAYGCPCWDAHELWNYEECNNPNSILHKMIPRSMDGIGNEECGFFREKP